MTKLEWFMADLAGMICVGLMLLLFVVVPIEVLLKPHLLVQPMPFWETLLSFVVLNVPGFIIIFVFRLNPFSVAEFIVYYLLEGRKEDPRRPFHYFCRWI